jgi:hypothetical protein
MQASAVLVNPPAFAAADDQAYALAIRLRVLSLGAGVQSTTLALMAAHGEIGPMSDCAIFADTGWEPSAVREHLAWLMSAGVLPFRSISSRAATSAPTCCARGSVGHRFPRSPAR